MNNIVAIIPARGGSKSIPKKNIKKLGGKPLIVWSIEIALSFGLRTIVNTDNKEIAKIAQKYGAETMIRPSILAQDNTPMYEVLKNEIPKIEPLPKLILLLQSTSPFRKKSEIEKAINLMYNSQSTSLISAEEVPEKYNPAQVMIFTKLGIKMADGRDIKERITERQDFPKAYIPTGSIYLFKTENLEKGSIYGDDPFIFITEPKININTIDDWKQAEQYAKRK